MAAVSPFNKIDQINLNKIYNKYCYVHRISIDKLQKTKQYILIDPTDRLNFRLCQYGHSVEDGYYFHNCYILRSSEDPTAVNNMVYYECSQPTQKFHLNTNWEIYELIK